MKADCTQMETLGDPCSKRKIECASDFQCLSRLAILTSCLETENTSESTDLTIKLSGDKDAFW
jgi:hypothetical protein